MDNSPELIEPAHAAEEEEPSVLRLFGGIVAMLAGAGVLLGGIILHFGEKAGRLVIFPFAGRLTILLAIGILAVGAAFAGRRAGIALGVVLLCGGLAGYAAALAFKQELGTPIYQALGLLTALVGLVIVYATYGMKDDETEKPKAPVDADFSA